METKGSSAASLFEHAWRLRHIDYVELAHQCGLVVDRASLVEGTVQDVDQVMRLKLDPVFVERFTPAELAIRSGHVVLRSEPRDVTLEVQV